MKFQNSVDKNNMEEETGKKKFEPFPVRSIRASDKVWNAIQKKRGGVSWNKFLLELVNK